MADLPAMEGKGLQFASHQASAAGFENITVHDALGRDRRVGDGKDWVICYQTPAPGRMPKFREVELAVADKPEVSVTVWRDGEEKIVPIDGEIEIRKRMNLSLSCDHRVVDGWDAASFMQAMKALIENPLIRPTPAE